MLSYRHTQQLQITLNFASNCLLTFSLENCKRPQAPPASEEPNYCLGMRTDSEHNGLVGRARAEITQSA